ncbi:hypothetical protein FHT77_005729 [Rhizobium sp. BK181]|uniref:hypothetical protein n=1 Tax=Rhizobium sp. BK181 TaxID=2587072 RepID=UPI0016124F71|nr:hypothetical protein [Rhizobium sp. BK181]MBB3319812.1 hypothetical protein [Rhizobium sp. BK181]
MQEVAINEDDAGTAIVDNVVEGTPFGNHYGVDNDAFIGAVHGSRSRLIVDFSFIKNAFKTLCREQGVTRDRKASVEIATLLLVLVKEGVVDEERLTRLARTRWEEMATVVSDRFQSS